jgi:protease-4
MSNLAASGGYWISCGAQRIVADPATLTGSIGVLTGHLNTTGFWNDKLGVTYGRIDRGANADIYGELDNWTDAQRGIVDDFLDKIYDGFVERVAAGRGMTPDEVRAIAAGRVFTGAQAVENGLVDVLGDLDTAIDEARSLAGIAPEVPVKLLSFPKPVPWWQQLLEQGAHREVTVEELRREMLEAWSDGVVTVPGVAWMPPIIVE